MSSKHSQNGTADVHQGNDSSASIDISIQANKSNTWLLNKLMRICGQPKINITLWDGSRYTHPEAMHQVVIYKRRTLLKIMLHPDLYFGEAFMRKDIKVKGDLVSFLEEIYMARVRANPGFYTRFLYNAVSRARRNSLSGSRKNISHHYDLSNDFYKLWLDTEAMQYTCAYYREADYTLEQAQVAKLDHVCKKLQLKPGETVYEAGCGWGGLARHMAKNYGVRVRSWNISHEQINYAREKAREMGLDHRIEYIEDDYRNMHGKCDKFVSVGMLEHVGVKNYDTLGKVISHCLKPEGLALVHSIGRNKPGKMNAWIEKRIFPGAETPSLREFLTIFEQEFSVLDVENIRLHYAQTLRHWLERFEQHQDEIKQMFDEDLIRAWRLYLAGSVAAFSTGQLQLFQVVVTKSQNNMVPRTREHMYQ